MVASTQRPETRASIWLAVIRAPTSPTIRLTVIGVHIVRTGFITPIALIYRASEGECAGAASAGSC